jgi:hypothetical protein
MVIDPAHSIQPFLPATSTMTTMRDRVMTILELCENIFLQLPTRDLLLYQSVCRRWHHIICSSPQLQKALFFRPAKHRTHYQFNHLLATVFPLWFRQYSLNPITFIKGERFKQLEWATDPPRRDACLRKEANWRKMLVCQPAVTLLVVTEFTAARLGVRAYEARLGLADGLRMGVIYDLTQKWVFDNPVTSFAVQWSTFPRPDRNESKAQVYKRYMRSGLTLAELEETDFVGEDTFQSSAIVRLCLHKVRQCCARSPRDEETLRSEGQQDVALSFSELSATEDPDLRSIIN